MRTRKQNQVLPRAYAAYMVSALLAACVPASAFASAHSSGFIEEAERETDDLIAKTPGLADVRQTVVDDCKAKTARKDADAFCTCGAAVTIALWQRNEPMQQRMAAHVLDPVANPASDFVKYEGPELYSPVCTDALGNS